MFRYHTILNLLLIFKIFNNDFNLYCAISEMAHYSNLNLIHMLDIGEFIGKSQRICWTYISFAIGLLNKAP